MPGLGDFGPLAGQLGGMVGSGLFGNLLGSRGSTPLENSVLQGNLTAQNASLGAGQNILGLGTGAVTPALGYLQSILSGNRGAITSALAPEIQRIGQGYQTAQQTSAALNPRGGPSVAFNAELPYMQQRDISTLMQQARPQAASSLLGAGGQLLNTGTNALYASTAAGRNILEQQQALRQLNSQTGQKIGAGLFGMFQQYGMPALQKQFPNIFGGGGGATSPSGPLPPQGNGPLVAQDPLAIPLGS